MQTFIQERKINLIFNCSHPFATELHQTIAQVAVAQQIDVIRLERQYTDRLNHNLVQYVDDYSDALKALELHTSKTLLALSGVQSIPKLKDFWATSPTYFRILDRDESKNIASDNNFPADQLILGLSDGTLTSEINTIKQKNIEVILTKESGESGGLSVKTNAALTCGIPIIILKKPTIPVSFQLVHDTNELKQVLQLHVSSKREIKA